MPVPDYCKDDPFLAGFLGGSVWNLTDAKQAVDAVALAQHSAVVLLVARGDDSALTEAGFRVAATTLTYRFELTGSPPAFPDHVRVAEGDDDAAACGRIAAAAFQYDRFHADPRIPNDVADDIKARWTQNNALGRARTYVSTDKAGQVTGFLALLPADLSQDQGVIDLIAVDQAYQGRGDGRSLFAAICHDLMKAGASAITVGTQAENTGSTAFYEALGFQEIERSPVWHWMPS